MFAIFISRFDIALIDSLFSNEKEGKCHYVDRIVYENVGPIRNVAISFPFEKSGNPKPVIFVGENGSGKSTILSNIVDAFYEMAGVAFYNARPSSGVNAHQYYKAINPLQIIAGQNYMLSLLRLKEGDRYG